MLLRLLEEGRPVDDVVFFDTGWEFPEMLKHIDLVERRIGREITRIRPEKSFNYMVAEHEFTSRKGERRCGYGWPAATRRWCTKIKTHALDKYAKDAHVYIGIAADEVRRLKPKKNASYPVAEMGMTEADCLAYCYQKGYDWDGLYQSHFRVSCYCCPLQRIGELRALYKNHPDLWTRMLRLDRAISATSWRGFRGTKTVHDLNARFAKEAVLSAKKAEPLCWQAERLTEQAKTGVLASDYNTGGSHNGKTL